MRLLPLAFLLTSALPAQWDLQPSHTTAGLRGIHALGGGVAWASGTEGTVLRTTDDGLSWQRCPTPPGAEHLDFRGIQAFDATTALVMSSGKGDLSRLYKTTDGCQSWKLVFTNPDKDGFWDAIKMASPSSDTQNAGFGVLVGDPVEGRFPLFLTFDSGDRWERQIRESPPALPDEGLFAASNSSLLLEGPYRLRRIITGGPNGARVLQLFVGQDDTNRPDPLNVMLGAQQIRFNYRIWDTVKLSSRESRASSGAFAIATRGSYKKKVIVGGDYDKPEDNKSTAWYQDFRNDWKAAQTPPHGYRSAVAYAAEAGAWITVGPNGTDLSTDDGRHWRALKPGPTEPADADRNWNALSLPFAVGPQGRIGRLRPTPSRNLRSSRTPVCDSATKMKQPASCFLLFR